MRVYDWMMRNEKIILILFIVIIAILQITMNKIIFLLAINLNNTYTEVSIIKNIKDEGIKYVIVREHGFKKIDAYIQENYELKKEFGKRT